MDDTTGLETALRYRLISPRTNWLVVAPRAEEEKAHDIPALRKVPQTLAAGWGGTGSVAWSLSRTADFAAMEDFNLAEIEPDRPALLLDLPPPYRRLVELINEGESWFDMADAMPLLKRAGLATDFEDLFQLAAELVLDEAIVASIVVARLLGGPMGKFVSGAAQKELASVQERAQKMTEALRGMGRHGTALARLTRNAFRGEVLRYPSGGETLEQLVQIQDLLQCLEDALRRSSELQQEWIRRAQCERGAIA
jgi:hypothetical protein